MARIFVPNDLFVTPHGRKKGVAAHLLQAAIDYAKTTGALRLLLSTATTNQIA
jgi:GNAT superfamily N-acetyltransferase